ncbi:hypothetical protein F5Y03DRAFT_14475 [Xylaria venustula]|nr:hypothetical protein F5Y03DRAFT_14475 [Xylaria venustula]
MSTKQTNFIQNVWHTWKSLRLPWRKRFFVGQDPQGNTYYELRQPRGDATENTPYRRLVLYPRSTPYSEVKVPPAWHQWLRYQRADAPTMAEQIAELQRQARIKVLAAEADARWEAKGSFLDMPGAPTTKTPTTATGTATEPIVRPIEAKGTTDQSASPKEGTIPDNSERMQARPTETKTGRKTAAENADPNPAQTETKEADTPDPWKRAQRGTPGQEWQPQAWTPASAPARKR